MSAPEEFLSYWKCNDELSVEGDCLLWEIRVIVPPKLQKQILEELQLHREHPGASRMKSLARSCIWSPGLDKDLERLENNVFRVSQQSRVPRQHRCTQGSGLLDLGNGYTIILLAQ